MAANIDPRGLADFFQLETEGENADTIPEMFRSHPATSERIASLNRLWEKSERKSGFVTLPALPAMTNASLTSLQERLLRSFKSLPK